MTNRVGRQKADKNAEDTNRRVKSREPNLTERENHREDSPPMSTADRLPPKDHVEWPDGRYRARTVPELLAATAAPAITYLAAAGRYPHPTRGLGMSHEPRLTMEDSLPLARGGRQDLNSATPDISASEGGKLIASVDVAETQAD